MLLSALLLLLVRAAECGGNSTKPHVIFLLVDDYGWGGAGWHNTVESGGQREVQTPNMDELVSTGINLNQHYTFKFCSPTRSALQSGRNPVHVNVQNVRLPDEPRPIADPSPVRPLPLSELTTTDPPRAHRPHAHHRSHLPSLSSHR